MAIRPEPGLTRTLALGDRIGLAVTAMPLFKVQTVAWQAPLATHYDGILAGSANVFRHGGAGLAGLVTLPVYAVGRETAKAAQAAGFTVHSVGEGGLQEVVDRLAGQRARLLRLAGAAHVDLQPPTGISIDLMTVYRLQALPLPDDRLPVLRAGATVLLHSAAAAQHFAMECDRVGCVRSGIRLAALGPRIAKAACRGWADVRWPRHPTDTALLALAREMCQKANEGRIEGPEAIEGSRDT